MSKNCKNGSFATVELVKSVIEKRQSRRVDWIVITSSEFVCLNLQKCRYTDFVVKCIMTSRDIDGRAVLDPLVLRRSAGQSWLFNLVIDVNLSDFNQVELDNYLKGLKDLGFCSIVNLHSSNNALLEKFSENYNVRYEVPYL